MINRRIQQGTTLIEVLVTLLLLAIGLLGLAGLQASSVQSNHSAYYRSQATVMAYDIIDRMRTNRQAARDGDYDLNFPEPSSAHAVSGSRAEQDQAEWLNRLAETLPAGTGRIESNNNVVIIHIRWDDRRGQVQVVEEDAESSPSETFSYRTEI